MVTIILRCNNNIDMHTIPYGTSSISESHLPRDPFVVTSINIHIAFGPSNIHRRRKAAGTRPSHVHHKWFRSLRSNYCHRSVYIWCQSRSSPHKEEGSQNPGKLTTWSGSIEEGPVVEWEVGAEGEGREKEEEVGTNSFVGNTSIDKLQHYPARDNVIGYDDAIRSTLLNVIYTPNTCQSCVYMH